MDLSMLNHSVLSTWGELLQVKVGNITHNDINGVFIDAYAQSPVGNTDVERPDPSFSFKASDWAALGAAVNDTIITSDGVTYSIISDPTYERGDWCNVPVSG